MEIDRRQQRSPIPDEAASLYLQSVAQRTGMRALAVADAQGLLIAGSGEASVLEQLAAVGAAREADEGPWRELLMEISDDSEYTGFPLDIDGMCFCVAALGGTELPCGEIKEALNRILLS